MKRKQKLEIAGLSEFQIKLKEGLKKAKDRMRKERGEYDTEVEEFLTWFKQNVSALKDDELIQEVYLSKYGTLTETLRKIHEKENNLYFAGLLEYGPYRDKGEENDGA